MLTEDRRAIEVEALGTALLVATVVGSGIMGSRLSETNTAVALLANSVATGAMLYVLITLLAPFSGAQFNPVVTWLLERRRRRLPMIAAQIAGGMAGAVLAHFMFAAAPVSFAAMPRAGWGQWLSETVATFGLLLTIRIGGSVAPRALPALVACWIVAAYWFTASTSFANPAVTIARALTGSFAGIRWIDVPAFILAQMLGAVLGNLTADRFLGAYEHESDNLAQPGLRHLAQDAGDP
jgi:glycerol uptake facilitator-like aquaporin